MDFMQDLFQLFNLICVPNFEFGGFTILSNVNKYQEDYASDHLVLSCYFVFSVLILVSYWLITPSMGYLVILSAE